MESPFRSEAAAFRFLLITIGAFALIVLASAASTTLGFLTFLGLSAAAVAVYLRQRGPAPDAEHVTQLAGPDERRVLVVANETVAGEELLSTISTLALDAADRLPRRLPGAQLAPQDVHVGRGSGARGGAAAPRRDARTPRVGRDRGPRRRR